MITVNPSETFAIPRAYILGLAIHAVDVSVAFEDSLIVVTDEIAGLTVGIQINRKINTSKPFYCQLKDFIQEVVCTDNLTGLPAEFDAEMRLLAAEEDGYFRVGILYPVLIEAPILIDFPRLTAHN